MKKILTLLFLLITVISSAQLNQIDVKKAIVRNWIIYQADTLAVVFVSGDTIFVNYGVDQKDTIINLWTRTGDDIENSNAGDITLNGQVFVPDITASGNKYSGNVAGIGLDDRLFPKSIVDLFNEMQDTVYLIPTIRTTWIRDTTNGYIYPAHLTDNVGIGTATPTYKLDIVGNLRVVGNAESRFTKNITSSGGGLTSALRVQTNCMKDITGGQWGGIYANMFTVAGQDSINEINGMLTYLNHSQGFRVDRYEGGEYGGGAISGAGTSVGQFYGINVSLPSVTGGASVDTAAGIHIGGATSTGITKHYAIFSEASSPSYFTGEMQINNKVTTGTQLQVGFNGGTTSSTFLMLDTNGINYEWGNGGTNGKLELYRRLNVSAGGTKSTVYYSITSGKHGFGTSSADNVVDINSSTGACLQLSYNDADGSAANKVNFAVSSSGDLNITPSGGDANITTDLTVGDELFTPGLDSARSNYIVYYNKATGEHTYDSLLAGSTSYADNMGNCEATQDVDMNDFNIDDADTVNVEDLNIATTGAITMSGVTVDTIATTLNKDNNSIPTCKAVSDAISGYTLQAYGGFPAAYGDLVNSTTYYFGSYFGEAYLFTLSQGYQRIYVPKTGHVKAIYFFSYVNDLGSDENCTLSCVINGGVPVTISSTLKFNTHYATCNNTSLDIAVTAGDYFELSVLTPIFSTRPDVADFSAVIYFE